MGYMGLSHWCDSDEAADFRYVLNEEFKRVEGKPLNVRKRAIRKIVREEFKNKSNEYNTCGFINVALVMEDEGAEANSEYEDPGTPEFSKLLSATEFRVLLKGLKALIKETDAYVEADRWDGSDDADYHKTAFKRLHALVLRKSYKE